MVSLVNFTKHSHQFLPRKDEKGTLSNLLYEAIIILIPKPGKGSMHTHTCTHTHTHTQRENYRPVSPMNLDEKILN